MRTRAGEGRAPIARLPYHATRLNHAHRTLSVGFVIDRWQPTRGGAERALASLASRLEASGHRVEVFAERGPETDEAEPGVATPSVATPGRVQLVRPSAFAWTRGARTRSSGANGVAAARAAGCDVTIGVRHLADVDVYWPHGGSHARSVVATRAARAWTPERPTSIESPKETSLTGRHRDYVALERALLEGDSGLRRVVCVSDMVRRELAEDFPRSRERLVTIENGVDLERFHPRARAGARLRDELSIAHDEVVVAFVAREPVLKGLPVLFAALARCSALPWTLVAAGTDDVAAWRSRAVSSGLDARRVRVLSDVDTAALFATADVTVLPTWRDTSGLVVLESLASGTPVIVTSAAGESHLVGDTRAGGGPYGTRLERPGDVDALVAALTTWIERARARTIDRDVVRARVADRDARTWLDRLEDVVVNVAAEISP